MTSNMRKLVFFVVLVCVSLLAYRFMVKPANEDMRERCGKIEIKLAKLNKFEQTTMMASGLSKQLEDLKKAVEFFESKLPPKSEVHKMLEQVTLIVQKCGLEPKTIKTLKRKNNNGYIEQPIKMELTGDFKSFYAFLLDVERLDRIMKIRELKLNKLPKSEGGVKANFIVSIFFQDEFS
ncbi:type 4a pilus biogenesis protein PilO [Planctomycetota bacterium]